MEEVLKRIQDYALEEIMGERFGAYAKEIIQDRAIPDVRDGLKPVQRRILYAMYRANNTHEHGYIKCAATVGDVLGKYHPHGDSSVYDAMVRMSQWWKQNAILIDIHGNNGSMDGDGPAAYRYTEARLAKISNELLRDLDKETVEWAPNFDDRFLEPTVLPAKFPNLLVNGANGISAGYATNIPPHNLGEICDATIKRIDSPNCRLDTILDIVKGPDFPTGGIVEGKQGIIDAFTTGRGKVVVRAKTRFVKEKGKEQIIIDEIPFDINKALLVAKMDGIRIDKKIEGMIEVRDESDREGMRIVIDLKPGANKELILNYLYKNTELQTSYAYNMVAIVNKCPMTLGILPLLDAYIAHQKEVIIRRSKFDLNAYQKRLNIVDGFLKMLSILDEVIRVIRASKNKGYAKDNLVKEFAFTPEQAEAIVTLQLYKLNNTDVVALEEEQKELEQFIKALKLILGDESKLKEVMKHELKKIKDEYAIPRKTEIKDELTEIKIDVTDTLPHDDVMVVVSHEGYVKRTSKRSYNQDEVPALKDNDYTIGVYEMNTLDTLLLFTDLGNYLYIPVYELPDLKWKELGKHISNIVKTSPNENIIYSLPVNSFDIDKTITFFTRNGNTKRSKLADFKVTRYSKPISCMKLKGDDIVVDVTDSSKDEVLITTANGYGLRYNVSEIPVVGVKASGVKAISLKDDYVISGSLFDNMDECVSIFTDKKTAKRVRIKEIDSITRARKGVLLIRDVKTNPYKVIKTLILPTKAVIGFISEGANEIKNSELPIMDRYSTGSTISKHNISNIYVIDSKTLDNDVQQVQQKLDLNSVDEKFASVDDILKDIKK